MSDHALTFSVSCTGAPTLAAWRETVRATEDLGYDSLLLTDHLHQELAPLPALVAAAAWTRTLRLGTFVLCQDLRNPAVLARELASVDILTDGRLDVGLGAGWYESDYAAAGVAFDPGPVRFARFEETLAIVLGSLADPEFTFHGKFHRCSKVDGGARSIQKPRPPVLVGGSRRKMLTLAAQRAEHVNIVADSPTDFAPAVLDEKVGWVRAAAGERFASLRFGHVVWECLVTPNPAPVVAAFSASLRCTPEELRQNPSLLVGSPSELVDVILARRERWGFNHVTIPQAAIASFAAVVAKLR